MATSAPCLGGKQLPEELFRHGSIAWGLGIEDTCVRSDEGVTRLDEYALTQHDVMWREDLDIVGFLGASFIRYGVQWPAISTEPGRYEWDHFDRVVERCAQLGVTVIADLVHYGTPGWLTGSFLARDFVDVYGDFAHAFATRYRGTVAYVTPLNEPLTTASFCGLRGVWPPYREGWDGWAAVSVAIATGMARGAEAIRDAAPEMGIVHVEAASDFSTDEPGLAEAAKFHAAVGWLPTDLLLGRVGEKHEMYGWLRDRGIAEAALEGLAGARTHVDFLGVNYYPDLTPRKLVTRESGVVQEAYDRGRAGLRDAVRGFAERYRRPVILTETSIEGDDATRASWMSAAARTTRELARADVDIRGFTWWPLHDFVDWSWASSDGRNVEEFVQDESQARDVQDGQDAFLRRMGLVRLERDGTGRLNRVLTAAATTYREEALPAPRGNGSLSSDREDPPSTAEGDKP